MIAIRIFFWSIYASILIVWRLKCTDSKWLIQFSDCKWPIEASWWAIFASSTLNRVINCTSLHYKDFRLQNDLYAAKLSFSKECKPKNCIFQIFWVILQRKRKGFYGINTNSIKYSEGIILCGHQNQDCRTFWGSKEVICKNSKTNWKAFPL